MSGHPVTSQAEPRPRCMKRDRVGAWISAVILGSCVIACASIEGPITPPASEAPSPPSLPSAEPSPADGSPGASPDDAPAELRVTCDGTVTQIPIPRVRARVDGIHVRFANPGGQVLPFGVDDATGLAMFGDSVPVGGGTFVFTIGTGVYDLGCGGTSVAFAVVDPDGIYTSTELGCGNGSGRTGTVDYGADARGRQGSVLDVARVELRGLRPGDLVEPAGYPASAGERLVRVARFGRVIAVLAYADDGHGGWLIGTTRTCPGAGITVEGPA